MRWYNCKRTTSKKIINFFLKNNFINISLDRKAALYANKRWDKTSFTWVKLGLWKEIGDEEFFIKFIEHDSQEELFNEILIFRHMRSCGKPLHTDINAKTYVTIDSEGNVRVPN